jgi:hypothetical protein
MTDRQPRFRRMLRPACRRHRLWTGPSARTHAGQLDVSPFPEIFRAQRRHLAQLRRHQRQEVEAAVNDATRAIYQALPARRRPATPWLRSNGTGQFARR